MIVALKPEHPLSRWLMRWPMTVPYTKKTPRTPREVVEQSTQPATALVDFLARALEAAAFDVSTVDWPALSVRVGTRSYTIGVGAGALSAKQLASVVEQLRRVLAVLDGR